MLRVIGIDFGTSSTYMNVKRYNGNQPDVDRFSYMPVMFNYGESSGRIESVVRENADGSFDFGDRNTELLPGSVIYREFKMQLESPDEAERNNAKRIVEAFFGFLYDTYTQQAGLLGESDDEEETLVSYPVKWKPETAAFMVSAAEKAGFKNVKGIDEATAAVSAVICRKIEEPDSADLFWLGEPQNLLLIDMGAGTTDLALCKFVITKDETTGGKKIMVESIATYPQSDDANAPTFGGREIDSVLTSYVAAYLRKCLDPSLSHMSEVIAAMPGQAKLWKERNVSPSLNKKQQVATCGYISPYLSMLSQPFPAFGRAEFEDMIADGLTGFSDMINRCLSSAQATYPEFEREGLDFVFLTGGHSAWYFTREMLAGKTDGCRIPAKSLVKVRENPNRIISLPNPQSTVSLGLVYNRLVDSLSIKGFSLDDWTDWIRFPPPPPPQDPASHIEAFVKEYPFGRSGAFDLHISVEGSNKRVQNKFSNNKYFAEHPEEKNIFFCAEQFKLGTSGIALTPTGIYWESFFNSGSIPWKRFYESHLFFAGSHTDHLMTDSTELPINSELTREIAKLLFAVKKELQAFFG